MRLERTIRLIAADVRIGVRLVLLALALGLAPLVPSPRAVAADSPGALTGSVTSAPGGKGVANADVRASRDGRVQARRTGADGGFSFRDLAPGRYTVSVIPPAGFRLAGEEARSVVVQSGKTAGGISFSVTAIPEPTATPKPSPTPVPTPELAVAPARTPAAGPAADAGGASETESTGTRPPATPSPAGLFAPAARSSAGPLAPGSAAAAAAASPAPLPAGSAGAEAVAAGEPTSVVGDRAPSAGPVGVTAEATTATPTTATAAPEPSAASASTDDILAGRGLHWRPNGIAPSLPATPPPAQTSQAAQATPVTQVAQASTVTAPDAARASQPRRVVTSFEALRATAGQVAASQVRSWANASSLWLGVPFKTQIDGTDFSLVNCGPASLAMVLAAFGVHVDPPAIRDYVNFLSGDYSNDNGTSLDVLARVAREAGLNTSGLYGGGGYRAWTVDAIREHVRAGQPVITLVKYRSLPGHGTSLAEFDHYIVITGLNGNDLIYNDSAFATEYGFNLLISPEDLERAWSYSSIPRHGVAVGLGTSLRPLPNVPSRLSAESLALGVEVVAEVEEIQGPSLVEPPLGMLPGAAARWLRERLLADRGAGAAGEGEAVQVTRPATEGATSSEADLVLPKMVTELSAGAEAVLGAAELPADVAEVMVVTPPAEAIVADATPEADVRSPWRLALAVASILLLVLGATLRRHTDVRLPSR